MMFFLQLVGAIFVALILFILAAVMYIKWKLRTAFGTFADLLKNLGGGGVPPFRIKLKKKSDVFDDDEEEDSENQDLFQQNCEEFASLGFDKIEDYYIEDIPLSMTAYVDRDTSTYGVVYDHPMAGVWCDVVRRYEDGSAWTFGSNQDSLMDYPEDKTIKYFPQLSLAEMREKFLQEAPCNGMVVVSDEEFPRFFDRAYAEEMDWRIARGGVTEAEIRRIAERDETECTPEHVHTVQFQWRQAISEFHSQRALRRYRNEAELSRSQWEDLEDEGIVVHQEMQAEEILQSFDEDYYPGSSFDMPDDSDPEYQDERDKWKRQLEEIREQLKTTAPQAIMKTLMEASDDKEVEWELKGSVETPIPADVWLRNWKDEDDDDEEDWDDD